MEIRISPEFPTQTKPLQESKNRLKSLQEGGPIFLRPGHPPPGPPPPPEKEPSSRVIWCAHSHAFQSRCWRPFLGKESVHARTTKRCFFTDTVLQKASGMRCMGAAWAVFWLVPQPFSRYKTLLATSHCQDSKNFRRTHRGFARLLGCVKLHGS